jgi:hypothetical protein
MLLLIAALLRSWMISTVVWYARSSQLPYYLISCLHKDMRAATNCYLQAIAMLYGKYNG